MRYGPKPENPVFDMIEPVITGLGMVLVELTVTPRGRGHEGAVQIRATVYKPGAVGVDDCAAAHRAILPRLALAFPEENLSVEVSSPGINRAIRDAAEFPVWMGRGLRCYRADTGAWEAGILRRADETGIGLETAAGLVELDFDVIARAKLDHSLESALESVLSSTGRGGLPEPATGTGCRNRLE
ncbi:MAG: ribosome assembly cofactor RimP [Spirochaetaceae bacterium]|jgi:ribosome maturation factor RimP|nr:ribosome assembly cofactor RimP [Spirochaetaceae bacterium]